MNNPFSSPYPLVSDGLPLGIIVVGETCDPFCHWVAEEIKKYLLLLTGADFAIAHPADAQNRGFQILVGRPGLNEQVARAQELNKVDFTGLKPDGFLLKTVEIDGQPALIVGGNGESGTMYAAYDFLERSGVVFQITGDLIPEPKKDLLLPDLDVRVEPALKYRGLNYYDFLMPWIGLDDFCRLLDQMAKMKMNYLKFFCYVGSPWLEYSFEEEKVLIGDLYPKEAGYRTLRMNTQTYTAEDMEFGQEQFGRKRVASPEFQTCETPEDGFIAACKLLTQVIDYAHQRKIQVWLAMGDCPAVPPNLGRHANAINYWTTQCGLVIAPRDPVVVEIWEAILSSAIITYPQADGYFLGLAEWMVHSDDPETKALIAQYDEIRPLIPSLEETTQMGYMFSDAPFFWKDDWLAESSIEYLHIGKQVINRVRGKFPSSRLGIYCLGRAFLFRAMDALFPKDIVFASMESAVLWNRISRKIPLELFGGMGERETVLIERGDDGESGFGMQFNVGLFINDQMYDAGIAKGLSGVAPCLGGRLRGTEHNVRFIAEGAWNPSLGLDQFYQGYTQRVFGKEDAIIKAYRLLDQAEMYMGLDAISEDYAAGLYMLGMGNFTDWTMSKDIGHMNNFRMLRNPFKGPDSDTWNLSTEKKPAWLRDSIYRRQRYREGQVMLKGALGYLQAGRGCVLPGARIEMEYLIYRTEAYIAHLEGICLLLDSYLAYDEAFRAKKQGDETAFWKNLDLFDTSYNRARDMVQAVVRLVVDHANNPTDRYLLFRYEVLFAHPVREFGNLVRNVVNFHNGQPYWQEVDWKWMKVNDLLFEG